MSITWSRDGDSIQSLGPSGIIQQATATFGLSDYVQGGYPVYPQQLGEFGHIRGMIPYGYSAKGSGTPAGYNWIYVKPAISGPAASNPGYLVSQYQNATTGQFVETASNTNFSAGTLDFLIYGW